ncbi:hypothetical protein O181_121838 [Austropuccinia psidii MF-1]|uniref:Uncharacterized protein n=1 Tax=Austropuccinia psidii MF-1 TaxID=1389203 RepID=A0A9Q3Q1M6_9BASI|nr:hypothetical protein [Austropuccinia psidii MF-1]
MFHLWSRDLLDVCKTPLTTGATVPALNKWTKINDQYASKRAINRGRVWMDWIWSNYHGDLQEYINSCRKMKLELEAVNIKIEAELLSFSILGKLAKDLKLQHYIEILTLNDEIIEKPDLILTKLQDFVNNTRIQPTKRKPEPSALSTSVQNQKYKITYYCTNGLLKRTNEEHPQTIHLQLTYHPPKPFLQALLTAKEIINSSSIVEQLIICSTPENTSPESTPFLASKSQPEMHQALCQPKA